MPAGFRRRLVGKTPRNGREGWEGEGGYDLDICPGPRVPNYVTDPTEGIDGKTFFNVFFNFPDVFYLKKTD